MKRQAFHFDKQTNMLRVYMNSQNPVVKGASSKAQKWLKSKGVFDATCWYEKTEPSSVDGGTWVTFHITSGILALRAMTSGVLL